jgi:hypothetical protein
MKNLQLNHTYLIRGVPFLSDIINSITILLITDKAYNIKWNNGFNSTNTWELKSNIENKYILIEDISDFVINETKTSVSDVKTKFVQCYVCKGFGIIPDNNSTAGSKPCPLCLGAKMIPEVTEISQK